MSAPYIYDISRLRVNKNGDKTEAYHFVKYIQNFIQYSAA